VTAVSVADRYRELGPATRVVWTRQDLAARYADLVSWRDQLYERHRPARS
jgi:glutathione S-transferase